MNRKFWMALILAKACSAPAAVDYVPLQEKSQGQSLTGGNVLNDSVFSNPAGSTFTQVYAVDAQMQGLNHFAVSILDTKNGSVYGGLGYFRRGLESARTQGGRLNLSSRISETWGAGITGKYVAGPTVGGVSQTLTDADLGLLGNFNYLQVGMTLRNTLGGNDALNMQRELAVGARFNHSNQLFFSATAVAKQGLKPHQIGFGAEYVSPYYFALKGGYYFLPSTRFQSWTGGLSFVSPKLSLHYAVEFLNERRGIEHQFGLTLLM